MEAFVGTIMPVSFDYAPPGWLPCEGQLLPIRQYQALYSLIGIVYGGDGKTTFALPDLRGRAPVGTTRVSDPSKAALVMKVGQVAGAVTAQGTVKGTANLTMDAAHLPAHTHQVNVPASALKATSTLHVTATLGQATPNITAVLGNGGISGPGQANIYVTGGTAGVTLSPASVTTAFADMSVPSQSTGAATPGPAPIAAVVDNGTVSVNVVQPSIGINFLIAVTGLFPSQS